MRPVDQRSIALLVVPQGHGAPTALADAVQRWHPDMVVVAVWAGDPQLHPPIDSTLEWRVVPDCERVLAGVESVAAAWWIGVSAARSLLADGAQMVVVFRVGSVAVLGRFDEILGDPATATGRLVLRVDGPLPVDGLWPDEDDLASAGRLCTSVASLGPRDAPFVQWLLEQIPTGTPIERLLERGAHAFDMTCVAPADVGVGSWRWADGDPGVIDLDGFDPDQPWVLDPSVPRPARICLVGNPHRTAAVEIARAQIDGSPAGLVTPGGIEIDERIRAWVRADPDSPPPWSDPGGFRSWLAERWWPAQRSERADLVRAFPAGASGDAEFARWCELAVIDDSAPLVLPLPLPATPTLSATSRPDTGVVEAAVPRNAVATGTWSRGGGAPLDGVDVIGYFTRQLGLSQVAVTIVDALAAAGVPVGALALEESGSPVVASRVPLSDRFGHRCSVRVVNADQMPVLLRAHPEVLDTAGPRIGYWFWEVERIPSWMRGACGGLDEVWVATRFVADAMAASLPVPVRHVPLPIADVGAPHRDRADVPSLAAFGDRFVFLVVFDYFSITERKNPIGAIEAFRRAFAPGEGPVLVIKTLNGRLRWANHERVAAAAGGRSDIVVIDEHLARDEHLALIASADALVSLHRSEGLGLHLAEAMWSATPVIATRYSGNLDFMDDSTSLLIDARLVPVSRTEGGYPADARWADPDLDQAAAAMRALVEDPVRGAALGAAGRARMQRQPTLADTGRLIAALLGVEMAS